MARIHGFLCMRVCVCVCVPCVLCVLLACTHAEHRAYILHTIDQDQEIQGKSARLAAHLQLQPQVDLSPRVSSHVVWLGGKVDVGAFHGFQLTAVLDGLPPASSRE